MLLHFIEQNKAVITAGGLLILKWIYNAWVPGTSFSTFVRTFIGEVIQEAPQQPKPPNPPATPAA
jgi:hypothetical protein